LELSEHSHQQEGLRSLRKGVFSASCCHAAAGTHQPGVGNTETWAWPQRWEPSGKCGLPRLLGEPAYVPYTLPLDCGSRLVREEGRQTLSGARSLPVDSSQGAAAGAERSLLGLGRPPLPGMDRPKRPQLGAEHDGDLEAEAAVQLQCRAAPPEAPASSPASAAPLPPGEVLPPPPVTAEGARPGSRTFSWVVPASKFKLRDCLLVSKPFFVEMGGVRIPFLVHINALRVDDDKGGDSFKRADGRGKLAVCCKKAPPATVAPMQIAFVVGNERRTPERHDFARSSFCRLPREQDTWDFLAAAESADQSVSIDIEIQDYEILRS